MTPPEFMGTGICGGCEGEGFDLDLSKPRVLGPLPPCRFCGGSGKSRLCPTCGEAGPDVYEPGEYGGAGDLRCGDEWHDEVADSGALEGTLDGE